MAWWTCISHIEISRVKLLREPIVNYAGTREQNTVTSLVFPKANQPMERSGYTSHFSGVTCHAAGVLGSFQTVLEHPHQNRCLCKISSSLQANSLLFCFAFAIFAHSLWIAVTVSALDSDVWIGSYATNILQLCFCHRTILQKRRHCPSLV